MNKDYIINDIAIDYKQDEAAREKLLDLIAGLLLEKLLHMEDISADEYSSK